MSYHLQPEQVRNLTGYISTHAGSIAEKIAAAVAATSKHGRPAAVTLAVKIGFEKDRPGIISVELVEKVKHAKSENSDLTAWDDPEVICSYDTSVAHGQMTIGGDPE